MNGGCSQFEGKRKLGPLRQWCAMCGQHVDAHRGDAPAAAPTHILNLAEGNDDNQRDDSSSRGASSARSEASSNPGGSPGQTPSPNSGRGLNYHSLYPGRPQPTIEIPATDYDPKSPPASRPAIRRDPSRRPSNACRRVVVFDFDRTLSAKHVGPFDMSGGSSAEVARSCFGGPRRVAELASLLGQLSSRQEGQCTLWVVTRNSEHVVKKALRAVGLLEPFFSGSDSIIGTESFEHPQRKSDALKALVLAPDQVLSNVLFVDDDPGEVEDVRSAVGCAVHRVGRGRPSASGDPSGDTHRPRDTHGAGPGASHGAGAGWRGAGGGSQGKGGASGGGAGMGKVDMDAIRAWCGLR
jgi:hypothetical protein